MAENITNFILLIGIIQGFIFNLFVFTRRRRFDKSIVYLNLCVLGISLNNLRTFIFFNEDLPPALLHGYLLFPWHLLVSPMFYVFLVYYFKLNGKIASFLRITTIMFALESLIRIYLVLIAETTIEEFGNYMVIEELINTAFSIFIFCKTYQLVFYRKDLLKRIKEYDKILWLKNTLKFSLLLMVLWVGAVVLYYFTREAAVYNPIKIMSSILIYWLGYQGLIHSKITDNRRDIRKVIKNNFDINDTNLDIKKYSSNLKSNGSKHEQVFQNIDSYIKVHQRYLDPSFSLETLAEELSIGLSHASKVINMHANSNFPDYINKLRVKQAKKLLTDDAFRPYKILAIGLESGFNSKSTFYAAFKKFTSQTPSEYREALL